MRADALEGLQATQKSIPPVWFYDERGSRLFEEITQLPEYYPTRAERALLEAHAPAIAELSKADTLVELGAGACDKTRVLLTALQEAGTLARYVPFDVSDEFLRDAAATLSEEFDALDIHLVIGDFHQHLAEIPTEGRRMVAFLGGTIGNLDPAQRARFLFDLNCTMSSDDSLLLGTDLVKDRERLVAAYDDAAGVTADFNRNVLHVLNEQLGATSTLSSSSTSPSGTRTSSGSRCGCGPQEATEVSLDRCRHHRPLRRRRGPADRDQRQVHARAGRAASCPRPASWSRACGAPKRASSCSPWPIRSAEPPSSKPAACRRHRDRLALRRCRFEWCSRLRAVAGGARTSQPTNSTSNSATAPRLSTLATHEVRRSVVEGHHDRRPPGCGSAGPGRTNRTGTLRAGPPLTETVAVHPESQATERMTVAGRRRVDPDLFGLGGARDHLRPAAAGRSSCVAEIGTGGLREREHRVALREAGQSPRAGHQRRRERRRPSS